MTVGLLSGCARSAAGPPPETADRYRGTFETICSPVDAQGVGFELNPESREGLPPVNITLWPSPGIVQGQQLRLAGNGLAAVHVGGTEWTLATDGEIGLDTFLAGQLAVGWFSLELSDGAQLSGRFEADWLDRGPVYCG